MESLHTDDCVGVEEGDECAPLEGVWDQPGSTFVALARDDLEDNAPWCRIRARAEDIIAQEGEEAVTGGR